MRTFPAAIVLCLGSAGCWNGELALHKPCENDDQCGRGQTCEGGYCDGPPAGATDTASSTTETGGSCEPPPPTTCDPSQRPSTRTLEATEIVDELFSAPIAVVAGDFVGDGRTDLAALSFGSYGIILVEGTGGFPVVSTYQQTQVTELVDLAVTDLEGDGSPEFLMLSELGSIEVVPWTRGADAFSVGTVLDLPVTQDAFTLTVADLVGADDLPELLVSTSTAIELVPNVGGAPSLLDVFQIEGDFDEPWDTIVVGAGADRRILVPESDDASVMDVANQVVSSFRIEGSTLAVAPPLGTTFQNPWALAEGDFLGDDELEIVVAERRLNLPSDDDLEPTTRPGRLRFFRLVDDVVTEVGEPLEVGVGPRALAAADLDCDGKTDLVLGNSGRPAMDDGQAQVLFGSCDAAASEANLVDVPGVGGSGLRAASRLAVGDFDGDGLLEVAIPDLGDIASPGERIVLVGVEAP
ncbi:MAG: VCBS repeat-containing protein [Myxococcales bacterium]|nr:VCBS repeat-containing protein [Myxococcales bacterium]